MYLHNFATKYNQTTNQTIMKKLLLSTFITLMGLTVNAADNTASITIDSRVKYQHVTGFGGFSPSPTWSYWLGDTEMNKLFGKGNTQLGLNIVRLYIANNKNAWSAGVANAKNAKKNGAIIFASPWSPPASWKSNNSESNGGELLESHWEDWAKFLNDYYLYMKKQGVEIDAISIQNEPDWNAEYQSCIWTGEKLAKFLRLYGSLIECKIIAPEAIHFTKSMHEPILNDEEACKHLDILGGHFYGWDGSSYPLAAQKGKEVWMTEFLINERQQNEKKNINWVDDGFLFAQNINDAMLANISAWVHYSLKRYYGCLGDGQFGTTENAITKRGYILSHYAKYVTNTTRIKHVLDDASGKISSSAYLSQTGDSIVVMVLNPSSDTYTTTFNLPFNTKGGYKVLTTSATTQNAKKTTLTFDEETHAPAQSIAAYSVNTFIFTKSSARDDMPEDEEDDNSTLMYADNYDFYGASCIPAGWRAKADNEIRKEGNYSLGPRIMGFSPEGVMKYAFYFRTGTAASGYVSYGEETNHRLSLEPGNYTLSYSVVGWKATPSVVAYVQKVPGSNVKMIASKPTTYVSESGSSVRITKSTDFSMDFEITATANYLLKWTISKASSGMNEALLGNVKLVKKSDTGGEDAIIFAMDNEQDTPSEIYDLCGRRLNQLQKGINIVKINGVTKKINVE